MTETMTHDALAHSLAQHLKCEGRMVWENIPAGMSGSVRPDVFTIEKSFSKPNPLTYEVKVSISDFRSDTTTAKWKEYLRFSYGVIFAVPKGLITKNDIPLGCGLMFYNGGGVWHTVKKPTLHPCNLDGDVLLKLLIGGGERMTCQKPIQNRDFDQWKNMETLRKKWGGNVAEKLSLIEKYPALKKEILALKGELGELLGVDVDSWNFADSAKYRIKQIKTMSNEAERKLAISKDLEKLRDRVCSEIDRTIREYTSGP